jgi:RNA polymerase sigma-54 factor
MGMIGMDLRARQQLALTPRLQQSVKLLQLSAMEFEQALQQAIGTNPFLEEDDPHTDSAPGPDADESDRAETPLDASTEGPDDAVEMIPSAGEGLEERFDFDVQSERTGNGQDSDDTDWTEWAETTTSLRDHLQQQLLSVRLNSRDLEMAGLIIEALDEDGYLRQSLEELAEVSTLTPQTEPEEFLTPLKLI